MEHTFFISAFISVRTEVITLGLDQVRRQYRSTVAVVVGNGSRESRYRNTVLHSVSHYITQRLLVLISNVFEVRSQQQVSDCLLYTSPSPRDA